MEWRSVVGYEGLYEVSENGDIRKLTGTAYHRRSFMRPRVDTNGYRFVGLTKNGKRRDFRLHRIVATAFHGAPVGDKIIVNHKDSDRLNNRAANLEWTTSKGNTLHAMSKDRLLHGSGNPNAKLNEVVAAEILEYVRENGYGSNTFLAKKYGVAIGTINKIIRGKTWRRVAAANADPELLERALSLGDPWMVEAGVL